MDKIDSAVFQLHVLELLINAESVGDLLDRFDGALSPHFSYTVMVMAIFDKFENEVLCYTGEQHDKKKVKELFTYLSGASQRHEEGRISSRLLTTFSHSSEYYAFDSYDISGGKTAFLYTEFRSKKDLDGFSSFFRMIMPQFWSLVSTHYKVMEKGEETAVLWSLRDAREGENASLNNIELNYLLENLLTLALAQTGSSFGAVLLLNESTGDLVIEPRAIKGKALSVIPDKLPANEESIARIVIETNRPYICDDAENDPHYYRMFHGIRSSLTVPISFQNRTIGVIAVESDVPAKFTAHDATLLQKLADEATMFIRRAQLYLETLKQRGSGIMIFGQSDEWKDVEKRVEKAARTNATVILRGESGTGKELLAHAIHFNSPRKDGPFVTLNCAAIPSELLESEMFGHVKGAFTGAVSDKIGEFKKAEHGTIFLDEIGDLPLQLQVKLLRVLQSGEIKPVGSSKPPEKVDVRVIAATSRPLEEMLQSGEFRMDMYYRLHVVPIYLPPLRNYKEEIPAIANNFVKEANDQFGTSVAAIAPRAIRLLSRYDYPGNVRQLRNFIQQAVIMADGDTIDIEDLPIELKKDVPGMSQKSFSKESEMFGGGQGSYH